MRSATILRNHFTVPIGVLEAVDARAASASALPRFHKNVVILLVAIPPTNLEAADTAFRFRFQNPG